MALVTQHYDITRPVPFLDVNVEVDNRLYVDPYAIRFRGDPQPFTTDAVQCLDTFFSQVLAHLTAPRGTSAWRAGEWLLQRFNEPRETRLGMARTSIDGHGAAAMLGTAIWTSLTTDLEALVELAILKRLEQLPLFVPGIGKDITSDITTRIVFGPLADYTATVVADYPEFRSAGHQLVTVSRQVWDAQASRWTTRALELPIAAGKPLILVPKGWARTGLLMSAGRYYDTAVLSYAQQEQAVVRDGRLLTTPKERLRRDSSLLRGRDTNTRVTLRAAHAERDLVADFAHFVDDRLNYAQSGE